MEGSVAKERGYTVKSPGTQGAGQVPQKVLESQARTGS